MSVRIGKILPPAVAPIGFKDVAAGILAMHRGPEATTAFTETLKTFFDVRHCYLLSSGKASLALILQALKDLHPGKDEVLIPAFTCYSVPAAISRMGLKIRICDIDPETLDFDYLELARQLSDPRLLCVIPTHLFGVTADIPRVREIVGDRDLPIVEDAAQTMGGARLGQKAGILGDVGFFSLERGKAFSTVKGGIIVTNSEAIADALHRHLQSIMETSLAEQIVLAAYATVLATFSRPWLYWIPRALPFLGLGETLFEPGFPIKQLSALQAGLATGWQNRLQENIRLRVKNSQYLAKLGIKASCDPKALSSGPLRYPVLVADKAEKKRLLQQSERLGLGAADVYPGTVDSIAGLQGLLVGGSSAKARSLVERMITLPVHPYVTETDLQKIAELIGQRAAVGAPAAIIPDGGGRIR